MARREEPLDEYEVLARQRLGELLGVTLNRVTPGEPGRRHDFETTLSDGQIVAVEVTSRLDDQRRKQLAAISDRLPSFALPGSAKLWAINLLSTTQVRKIRQDEVRQLLLDLESAGRRRAHHREDYRDEFAQRLHALGIAAVYAFDSSNGGRVVIGPDTYGGRGWYGEATDTWPADFLASDLGKSKIEKLNAVANAAQRHLVVVLDPTSPEGMAISLGLTDRDEPEATALVMPSD